MKLIALLSGGIDSPVAAYRMCQAGAEVVLLHMDNTPYSDEVQRKDVMEIARILREATGQELPLWFAPHGDSQTAIHDRCDYNYQCVMCKRVMQRTARELGKKLGCSGIVMGDSLGQVASQTLRNIRSENIGLDFPVARPLIGYDKIEIEAIAKEIETYDVSIRPGHGCSIVPVRPITEAKPEKVVSMSETVDIDALARASADAAYLVQ
ncbi:tRNA 4-thiouridine(8) synthase ThiI [Candidatus Methanoprimaticola sp. MG2]|uniref:tRNA 4-thiouridine(8) synthase ThiI n=1 Tax=Candidatus Methanoprimaticola sp. MG2 TaxID=3228838 RepID=UPI0039C6323E